MTSVYKDDGWSVSWLSCKLDTGGCIVMESGRTMAMDGEACQVPPRKSVGMAASDFWPISMGMLCQRQRRVD